jgi:Fur family zinc uptake transcriptional regulator
MAVPPNLTRNQRLVLARLATAGRALTAYDILDAVRAEGLRAPVQVYRALEKLRGEGLVHRIESLNAFVACAHFHPRHEDSVAFAICERCGTVSEFPVPAAARALRTRTKRSGFVTERTTVELHGRCAACAACAGDGREARA